MSATQGVPKYRVEVNVPVNGRLRKAEIVVSDGAGKVVATDRADLAAQDEMRRCAARLAGKLKREPETILRLLEEAWTKAFAEHRRRAAQHGPDAAPEVAVELLADAPPAVRRPLCLVGGRAYAAAWVHARRTERPPSNGDGPASLPLVSVRPILVIVRGDGLLYAAAAERLPGARPLEDLGLPVNLPLTPPPGQGWSGAGVRRYAAGERPDPADVFRRACGVADRFVDFSRSLAKQEEMCELVACYVLLSYLLDAFHVVGYLWPNGEHGAGKTTLLQVVTELGYLGTLILAGSSYASLRDLADYGAVLAFDDAEAVMDPRRTDPDKRTLLLAGNRRGATVTVKEPAGDRWVMRHISTFCPRLFSAIRLPDPVLGSRSIIVPLVRSADPRRAKANPLDHASWPCDRRRLLDDLWALGLAHLPELPAFGDRAAGRSELSGRDLEPWRGILAVALWLQERHGVGGLYDRMAGLSVAYQAERRGYETDHHVRILFAALLAMLGDADELTFAPKDLAGRMNELAEEEDLAEPDKPFTSAKRVGWALKKQRFEKADRGERCKRWKVTRGEVEALAKAYGAAGPEPDNDAGDRQDPGPGEESPPADRWRHRTPPGPAREDREEF